MRRHIALERRNAGKKARIRSLEKLDIPTVLAIGAFFFMNNALPKSQVKMWTLLFSMRQTSPTLDIPEGTVYSQIPGYNIYVKRKDKERDMLYNLLIYDVSPS